MAHLSGTQKKNRNKFVALLVAILVVAAAIFYVVYSAFMAKSSYLENQDFASALATAFDKAERKVSKEDLAKVKYLEISNNGNAAYVAFGYEDFVSNYNAYFAEVDAAEKAEEAGETVPEIKTVLNTELLKVGEFEVDETVTALPDIKYFTGAEVVTISSFDLDAATLAQFKNIKTANFSYCGITNEELKAFAEAIDLTKVEKLTFMGDSITDWSPVESISDKVDILSYTLQLDESGTSIIPVTSEQTLTEYLAAQAKSESDSAEGTENAEETVEGAEVAEENAEEPETEADAAEAVEEETTEAVEETETAEVTE